jgi:hypothetical protein
LGPVGGGQTSDVGLVRFLAGLAEWLVYDALGGLSPAGAEAFDDAATDPLDF